LRAEAVHPISRASQHGRDVGAAVVRDLPEREARDPDVDDADESHARASLDLECVAPTDVDVALAEVDVVAQQCRGADLSLPAREDGAAERELMRPEAAADARSAAGVETAGGSVERPRGHDVTARAAPAQPEGVPA